MCSRVNHQLAALEGLGGVHLGVKPGLAVEDVAHGLERTEPRIDALDDVFHQTGVQRLVDELEMPFCHRVGQHVRGAGGSLEPEQFFGGAGAAPPQAVALIVDKRGHVAFVQQRGVAGRVLQVKVHVFGDTHRAVQGHVRQALVPALLPVDLGAQAHRVGHCRHWHCCVCLGVPGLEVRPNHHGFALAKPFGVGQGLAHILRAVCRHVGHSAQLLGCTGEGVGYRLGVQARRTQNAGLHAQFLLGGQKGLNARAVAAGVGADH